LFTEHCSDIDKPYICSERYGLLFPVLLFWIDVRGLILPDEELFLPCELFQFISTNGHYVSVDTSCQPSFRTNREIAYNIRMKSRSHISGGSYIPDLKGMIEKPQNIHHRRITAGFLEALVWLSDRFVQRVCTTPHNIPDSSGNLLGIVFGHELALRALREMHREKFLYIPINPSQILSVQGPLTDPVQESGNFGTNKALDIFQHANL
jgi:hypothetical protein